MTRLVKISCLLGDQWTVITREQATYEAAAAIRDKYKDEFNNAVLLLGLRWLSATSRSFVRLPGIQASARRERQQDL